MKRRDFLAAGATLPLCHGCAAHKKVPSFKSDLQGKAYEPIRFRGITIPNRIVFPAVTNRYADAEGFVTRKLIEFHRNIAAGGAGLSIIGATAVRKDGILISNMHRLDHDRYIDGMGDLFHAIKQQGSVACIQLFHGGRKTMSAVTGVQPVAPSPLPHPGYKETPRELPIAEIGEFVELFAAAAERAKKAGADMIELHGAHGYLIAQFLSPFSNQRTDRYGGSTENRTRFIREILRAVRTKVGSGFPLSCRISAEEYVEGGISLTEAQNIAKVLVQSGVDIISVSAGIGGDRFLPGKEAGRQCYAHLARGIREMVDVPVIGVGNIIDMNDAETVLQNGDADFAAMGRALIADPRLVVKSASGRTGEVEKCIQCGNCLRSLAQGPMTCSVNKSL